METAKRKRGERGPQALPTQADRRRYVLALRQKADSGDPGAIAALLTLPREVLQ